MKFIILLFIFLLFFSPYINYSNEITAEKKTEEQEKMTPEEEEEQKKKKKEEEKERKIKELEKQEEKELEEEEKKQKELKKKDPKTYYINNLLKNPDKVKRRFAANILKNYTHDPQVIKALFSALNDYDTYVQKNTLRSLKYINTKQIQDLKSIIKKIIPFIYSKNITIAREAILTLGKIGDNDVSYILAEKIFDKEKAIQLVAIWALCQIKNPLTFRKLIEKLFDDNPTIRKYTTLWISNFRDRRIIRFLEHIYQNDTDLDTRQSAALSLRKFGIDKVFPKKQEDQNKDQKSDKEKDKSDLINFFLDKEKKEKQ